MKTICLLCYILFINSLMLRSQGTENDLRQKQKLQIENILQYLIVKHSDSIKPFLENLSDTLTIKKISGEITKYAYKQPYLIMTAYPDSEHIIYRVRYYNQKTKIDLFQIDFRYEETNPDCRIKAVSYRTEKELLKYWKRNRKPKTIPPKLE